MSGDAMFSCICIAITAPIKREMTTTSGMESTPSLYISFTIRRADTLHLSGIDITRVMNIQYRPNVSIALVSIIFSGYNEKTAAKLQLLAVFSLVESIIYLSFSVISG